MADVVLMGDPRIAAIPVVANTSELVDLRGLAGLQFGDLKAADSESYTFLQSEVAGLLELARDSLPSGLQLLVVEGHRPFALQERYFAEYLEEVRTLHPGVSADEAYQLASRYVSPPSIAPHVSGAAIDLTLVAEDGEALDLGASVNATPEESHGACYFEATNITPEARRNRKVLAGALQGAGFVNYPTEWWHWSYGDRYWAFVTGTGSAKF